MKVFVALLLVASASLAQQTASPASPVSGVLERENLTFDFLVNNSGEPYVIKKVGVWVTPVSGSFNCLAEAVVLTPKGDYLIPFHVSDRETLKEIVPIKVGRGGIARMRITLAPDATGACGFWEIQVEAGVVLANGESLRAGQHRLTSNDIAAAAAVQAPEDLRRALQHANPEIRAQAVRRLAVERIPKPALRQYVTHKLSDLDSRVRVAALTVAANLGLTEVGDEVCRTLREATTGSETDAAANALGTLRHAGCVNGLVDQLAKPGSGSESVLRDALVNVGSSSVAALVRPVLASRKVWAAPAADRKLVDRYLAVVAVLVAYRDMKSISALSSLLATPSHKNVTAGIMKIFEDAAGEGILIQDPFLLAAEPIFGALVSDLQSPVSRSAASVLERFPAPRARAILTPARLRNALRGPDAEGRGSAARLAATLDYADLSADICAALGTAAAEERQVYEAALSKLGTSCLQHT